MKRVALNGFGRIGKNFLRAYLTDSAARDLFAIIAINIGPADRAQVAYMIAYDSVLPHYDKPMSDEGDGIRIDGLYIRIIQGSDAELLPWRELDIDYVVEATGHYTHADDARSHIRAGARKVIITAPAHGHDKTIVMGVNNTSYRADTDTVISLGSCTTNALVPLIAVMKEHAVLTYIGASTVHAYTATQSLLDKNPLSGDDPRMSRAAASNIIPFKTGAAQSVVEVFPAYKALLVANAVRVPVADVSLADVMFVLDKPVDKQTIDGWFSDAADTLYSSILSVNRLPLVSSDFKGNSNSVIVDQTMTIVSGNVVRLYGWYDNEWGYSKRINDILVYISQDPS